MSKVEGQMPAPQPPSTRKLAVASGIALAGAAVLLVTAVLPAEYGIDPLGTGKAFGFLALSGQIEEAPPVVAAGEKLVPVQEGPVGQFGGEYKIDTAEFVLDAYEFVEYKYHLEKGASMLFTWSSSAPVVHDFHGEPDVDPKNGIQSFDKRNRSAAHASFVAPFTGIHGWYWENPGAEPITIRITSAGFYDSAHEFRFDGSRHRREVSPVAAAARAD